MGRQLEQAYRGTNNKYGATAFDLKTETVGSIRPLLITLLGAVGFVLLIACVNLANLLLARTSARSRETAIRAALGAGRRRIARQFFAEGLLISAMGAAAGVLVAMWSTGTIAALAPAGLPSFAKPHVDWRVLLFLGSVSLACGILLGLLPAVQGSRTDVNDALKQGSRGSSGGPGSARLRSVLVIAEVALSLLLLTGAGLMVRSFVNLQRIDVGFRADRAATLRIALPRKYDGKALAQTMNCWRVCAPFPVSRAPRRERTHRLPAAAAPSSCHPKAPTAATCGPACASTATASRPASSTRSARHSSQGGISPSLTDPPAVRSRSSATRSRRRCGRGRIRSAAASRSAAPGAATG